MVTLSDVDEALNHARAIPVQDRTSAWHAFVDGLLEQRNALEHADTRIAQIKAERAGVGRA